MTKRQQQENVRQSRDSGYTIIESLVAMIVVSVLMIAIAPVMAFSVATRVQARRMELATQAARAYIDALRTGNLKPNDPNNPGFPVRVTATNVADAVAPTGFNTLYCVDMDGGKCSPTSPKDFYVQGAWRNPDPTVTNDLTASEKGYELMVRVYRADSFAADAPTLKGPDPKRARQSIVGAGLGDRSVPVVEMTTEIAASGTPSYKSICARLKGTNGCQ